MYSCPLALVHVILQASEQVWQAMHLLRSKTIAHCRLGRGASYGYSMLRLSCQFNTCAIVHPFLCVTIAPAESVLVNMPASPCSRRLVGSLGPPGAIGQCRQGRRVPPW